MGTAGLRALEQSADTSEVKPIARFLELRESKAITGTIMRILEGFPVETTVRVVTRVRDMIFPTFLIGGSRVVGISMNLIILTMMNWKQVAVRH